MKLTGFEPFPPLQELQQTMGTEEAGHFELFDPERHITYNEREALDAGSLMLAAGQMMILKDKTIAFKNTRIWLSWTDHNCYHLAACESVKKRRYMKSEFIAGTDQEGIGKLSPDKDNPRVICTECLQLLKYQGLDARRGRRMDDEEIQKNFSLEEFQKQYPFYPLV